MGKRAYLIVTLALLAIAAGLYAGPWVNAPAWLVPAQTNSASQTLFGSTLRDLKGNDQPFEQWRGKVLVVNFWATWCPPCKKEIPQFIKVQEKYRSHGLVIVGVALDKKDAVSAYAADIGINYPLLIGGFGVMDLTRKAGNNAGALPFTLIIDRTGKIVATRYGGLTLDKLEPIIRPLL
ncbi:MAG TPA: TlpA disulfide reductase family protein [Burkholderiales bacterium]|nr:TlpA disulfide reductase family protein [Burkholderiales bacterium]